MAVLAIGRGKADPVSWVGREPTVAEILSDSIVKAVMEADGIDPQALEHQLRRMAREICAARRADSRVDGDVRVDLGCRDAP